MSLVKYITDPMNLPLEPEEVFDPDYDSSELLEDDADENDEKWKHVGQLATLRILQCAARLRDESKKIYNDLEDVQCSESQETSRRYWWKLFVTFCKSVRGKE